MFVSLKSQAEKYCLLICVREKYCTMTDKFKIPIKFLHDFCEIPVFQTIPYNRTASLYKQDPHCMVSNFADLLPMNSFAFDLCIQGLLDVREKTKSQEILK